MVSKKKNFIVPKQLPDCLLLRELVTKSNNRHDIDFDFSGQLIAVKERVSPEMSYINTLFPEYTPHDEHYHIKNMFHVADRLLGENLIQSMNSAELLVLALAIYGHDWGMAVSDQEKNHVIQGNILDSQIQVFLGDPEEHQQFLVYAKDHLLTINEKTLHLDAELWRNYVRETHHIRSGRRIRKYLENIGLGIGDAVARVCESHGLDSLNLNDPTDFPVDFSVLREKVNIRAIAVYLRLIDLFDLGDDRTPYVIWNFVWPRDPQSMMNWEKHRALQPVTFTEFYPGRAVKVDGSTDDHEVYASLEDLKRYCQDQLEQCCGIMSRMSDPRHKLDLSSSIQWRISARGFKPVSIRFEFDRDQMFEILGSEIYHGDRHVFLRELLQNSIDAIRLRRAAFLRQGMNPPSNLGIIHVTVQSNGEGGSLITWQDDGAGMDEYIVANYLAVAGRSYYQSHDFQKMGLEIDPISRFGIGILSCFIVADRIEIFTFKERYLPSPSKPIHIVIPTANRQFRIEEMNEESAKVGTTVKVFVKSSKLIKSETGEHQELDVTSYLSKTAGFIEFPILIDEDDKKTIILSPYHNQEDTKQLSKDYPDYTIHQLNLNYPWSDVIWPNDLATAKENYYEEKFNLKYDLKLEDYEGVLSYLAPNNYGKYYSMYGQTLSILTNIYDENPKQSIRIFKQPFGAINPKLETFWTTLEPKELISNSIFRDGILIPQTTFSGNVISVGSIDISPILLANLPKSRSRNLDVARTEILSKSEEWCEPIFNAWVSELSRRYREHFLRLTDKDRLAEMINFFLFHHIPLDKFNAIIPYDFWPLLFMNPGGGLTIKLLPEILNSELAELPDTLSRVSAYNVRSYFSGTGIVPPFNRWEGRHCLANFATWHSEKESIVLAGLNKYYNWIKTHFFRVEGVHFLNPPWEGNPPLLQEVWTPVPTGEILDKPLTKDDFNQLIENPTSAIIDSRWYRSLKSFFTGLPYRYGVPLVSFPQNIRKYYSYGREAINVDHPSTQTLIKLLARISMIRQKLITNKTRYDYILSLVYSRVFGFPQSLSSEVDYQKWAGEVEELKKVALEENLLTHDESDYLLPDENSFIPGSTSRNLDVKVKTNWEKPFGTEVLHIDLVE
jgi:hypothetical protein